MKKKISQLVEDPEIVLIFHAEAAIHPKEYSQVIAYGADQGFLCHLNSIKALYKSMLYLYVSCCYSFPIS